MFCDYKSVTKVIFSPIMATGGSSTTSTFSKNIRAKIWLEAVI